MDGCAGQRNINLATDDWKTKLLGWSEHTHQTADTSTQYNGEIDLLWKTTSKSTISYIMSEIWKKIEGKLKWKAVFHSDIF